VNNSDNDWHGGAQIGYNWQSGCTVFGVQADWSWTNAHAESFHQDFPTPGQQTLNVDSHMRWFGTARARTGLVIDNVLLYVTGGAAFAHFNRDLTYFNGAATTQIFESSRSRIGFVVGAGTEWSFAPNWSFFSEFMYMGFEKDRQNFACSVAATCGGAAVGTPFRFEFNDSMWVSRIGLNYRFSYGPVVAKY
jgi:outer membrane immunogenic protein